MNLAARQAAAHWGLVAILVLVSLALGAWWLWLCWPVTVAVLVLAAGAAARLAWLSHRYPNDGGDWPP